MEGSLKSFQITFFIPTEEKAKIFFKWMQSWAIQEVNAVYRGFLVGWPIYFLLSTHGLSISNFSPPQLSKNHLVVAEFLTFLLPIKLLTTWRNSYVLNSEKNKKLSLPAFSWIGLDRLCSNSSDPEWLLLASGFKETTFKTYFMK